jgi:uncharacterized phage protein (predicted DNA packaging)
MLTLDEAKTHLRVDGPDDDAYIEGLILVAQEYIAAIITPAPIDGFVQPAPAVNETQRHAARLLIGHWFANREAVSDAPLKETPVAVRMLLHVNRPVCGMM